MISLGYPVCILVSFWYRQLNYMEILEAIRQVWLLDRVSTKDENTLQLWPVAYLLEVKPQGNHRMTRPTCLPINGNIWSNKVYIDVSHLSGHLGDQDSWTHSFLKSSYFSHVHFLYDFLPH